MEDMAEMIEKQAGKSTTITMRMENPGRGGFDGVDLLPPRLLNYVSKFLEYTGKTVSKVTYHSGGTREEAFAAIAAARKEARASGYSAGSLCCDEPMALVKGHIRIAKWFNIGTRDWRRIDGLLLSNDMRNGGVWTVLFN